MVKFRVSSVLAAVLLLFCTAVVVSCSGSDGRSTSTSMLGGATASSRGAEDGFLLTADPVEVIFDLTDPNAVVDPNSGLLVVDILLEVSAVDSLGVAQPDLVIVFGTNFGSLASAGAGVMTDIGGLAGDTLTVLNDVPDEITVTATDGTRMETLVLPVIRILPNSPPVADAGMDIGAEWTGGGTPVTLDGSASSDPDSTAGTNDDIVSFEWFEGFGSVDELLLGDGEMLEVALAFGTHSITLVVTDSEGESASDELQVDIVDTIAPTLSLVLDPNQLWPPNHKMRAIGVTPTVIDACSEVTVTLLSVSSNEPDNGIGDGDTANDIQGVDLGSSDFDFMLRAERMGSGSGRVYTIDYEASDSSGNATAASGTVLVPHDMGS